MFTSFTSRAAILSAAVVMFLIAFKPFSVAINTLWHLSIYLGLGLVIFVVLHLNHYVFYPLIKKIAWINDKQRLLIGRVYSALLALTAIYTYFAYFTSQVSGLDIVLLLKIALVALLTIFAVHHLSKQKLLKQQIMQLRSLPEAGSSDVPIQFASENGNDILQLRQQDLLYIQAEDNYVTISYLLDGRIKDILLRSTLSALENSLSDKGIARCHRSYLINLANIERMHRRTGRMVLKLRGFDVFIPVSRSYVAAIRNRL